MPQKAKSDAAEAKAAAEAAKRTPASLLTGVVAPPQHWAPLADRAALLEMHWLPIDGARQGQGLMFLSGLGTGAQHRTLLADRAALLEMSWMPLDGAF